MSASITEDVRHLLQAASAIGLPDARSSRASLERLASRDACSIAPAVRAGLLKPHAVSADDAATILLRVGGWENLHTQNRFLAAKPVSWARFTEPQITGGWAHFLRGKHSLARCQAVFDAAWHPETAPALTSVEPAYAELGRIDLLVVGTANSHKMAVCIEAKFGHFLASHQLDGYAANVSTVHGVESAKDRRLLVLAPHRCTRISGTMQLSPEWRFLRWQDWLVRYENALPSQFDDEEFQSFRRTVLDRTYQEKSR